MTVSELSERELIARVQQRLPPAPPWVVVGIGDDAAVIEPERNHVDVLTVDACVEGIHFDRRLTPPDAIGHRALAVNLSDLAAMGARPRAALLSFALPAKLPCADFDAILDGVARAAAANRIHVVGGNLTRSPGPLMLDVTVTGTAKRRKVLTRAGARAGDEIYVTGTIGGAAAGLAALQERAVRDENLDNCVKRYLYPEPRVRAGLALGRTKAVTACMDLSDGLADAVRQTASASRVGAIIHADALPVEAGAMQWFLFRGADPVFEAIRGGDDYELLVTASPRRRRTLHAAARTAGVTITRIGVCTAGSDVLLQSGPAESAVTTSLPSGFSHFR